jgi:hypothetical protein
MGAGKIVCDRVFQRGAIMLVLDAIRFVVADLRTLGPDLLVQILHTEFRNRFAQFRGVLRETTVAPGHGDHGHGLPGANGRCQELRADHLGARQIAFVQVHIIEEQDGAARRHCIRRRNHGWGSCTTRIGDRGCESGNRALVRRTRLDREGGNCLRLAAIKNSKVVFSKGADSAALRVAHDHRNKHGIYGDPNRRILVRRRLSRLLRGEVGRQK